MLHRWGDQLNVLQSARIHSWRDMFTGNYSGTSSEVRSVYPKLIAISRDSGLPVIIGTYLSHTLELWLGVALCGRRAIIKSILPSLAELRDYPYFRPDLDAAAWTGSQGRLSRSWMLIGQDHIWTMKWGREQILAFTP